MKKFDKAGKDRWDQFWETREQLPKPVDPRRAGLRNTDDRAFHRYFHEAFREASVSGGELLEVGCGRSRWLPYFAKEYGFTVSGVDYSEKGCRQCRAMLEREGVNGDVLNCNFFDPPEHFLERFDVLVSFGVVEHFEDTPECLRAFARYLKPGGIMITNTPNEPGWIGRLQRLVDKEFFESHVLLDRDDLASAHKEAGLTVLACEYFMVLHLGVVNIDRLANKHPFLHRIVYLIRVGITGSTWVMEALVPFLKPNRFTSPYIHCMAKKG